VHDQRRPDGLQSPSQVLGRKLQDVQGGQAVPPALRGRQIAPVDADDAPAAADQFPAM